MYVKLNFSSCKGKIAFALAKVQDLTYFHSYNSLPMIYLIVSLQVKDLEVELETTKQKSKETLQQAILSERERLTQIQWDMEELRRKSLEMEWKLKSKQVIYLPIICLVFSFCL